MKNQLGAEPSYCCRIWNLAVLLPIENLESLADVRLSVELTYLLIQPAIPTAGYVPGAAAIERMIAAGERAVRQSLARWQETGAA